MNGAGNDFVVLDNRFFAFSDEELSGLAVKLCPRRTAVGADGLLALCDPTSTDAAFRMKYYNSDGSRGTMCGNGARCLVRFAHDIGLIDDAMISFESDAGLFRAQALLGADMDQSIGLVRVYFPTPSRYRSSVLTDDRLSAPIDFVWPGTEHAVCYVDKADSTPVDEIGRDVRWAKEFGENGANVDFVEVAPDGKELVVRTFEKGVEEETLACGTGAVAAAIVSYLTGRVSMNRIPVKMKGGTLTVGFDLLNGAAGGQRGATAFDAVGSALANVYLEGPTEATYRASIALT